MKKRGESTTLSKIVGHPEIVSFIPINIFFLTQYSFLEASYITNPRAPQFPLCSLSSHFGPSHIPILGLAASVFPYTLLFSLLIYLFVLVYLFIYIKILEFLSLHSGAISNIIQLIIHVRSFFFGKQRDYKGKMRMIML